jgi:endonuclease YncB( thermonuclease family)
MNELTNQLINIKYDDIDEFTLKNIRTVGKIVDVYDGDTCTIVLIIKNDLYKFKCRLTGLDTPEIKPLLTKCNRDIEIAEAHKCKNRLIQLSTTCEIGLESKIKKTDCKKIFELNTKIITVMCHEFDKYGRLLVSLFDDDNTISYNEILIKEGYAIEYNGGHKEGFIY